jgi:hypothetical protein
MTISASNAIKAGSSGLPAPAIDPDRALLDCMSVNG